MAKQANTERTAVLVDVEADLAQARADRNWNAASALYKLVIKLRGLEDAPVEPFDEGSVPDDPLEANLYRIRFVLRQMHAQGKITGIDRLLAQERAAVEAIEARDRDVAAKNRQAPKSRDEMIDFLVKQFLGIPSHVRDEAYDRIAAEIGEAYPVPNSAEQDQARRQLPTQTSR